MVHEQHEQIFRTGSKTYYFSSRFFPKKVRDDVYILYGFVRVADNLVDDQPVDPQNFSAFRARYEEGFASGKPTGDHIIDAFLDLQQRKNFDPKWTEAFLDSMQHDLVKSTCETLDETLEYIYGSAEVIGLFMARIMNLPEKSFAAASMLGRAMQYINFLRDIQEDNGLGRRYLPLTGTSLTSLSEAEAIKHPDEFARFIRTEVERYQTWQRQAASGYRYIPRRYRIPIMTAADMYCWTAQKIAQDPTIVFRKRLKPSKSQIIRKGLAHLIGVAFRCNR
ncbi:phytoene/squalene synthase family protein [Candidatus Nomurabacteria bacterium]|nr:phytoene/squalene synthase family protein [Candidatus Nomurabacteria bacterium]